MANESRSSAVHTLKELGFTGSGPFEAIVVSHLDPNYMGGLKVDLLRKTASGSLPERVGTTIEVRYLSPFYGVTNPAHTSANDGYSSTQKSYGMWFVPPDTGTKVLVTFAEGDIARGYWIGCIQDQYMNFMVPDGRASTELTTGVTPKDLKGRKLPTGEYNKKASAGINKDPTAYDKPYNEDFTATLMTQGLLSDEHRGLTTSSARREVPSSVFGINTPGPVDKRPGAPMGLYGEHDSKANVFVNRLGGFSLVMDDGDDKFIRKTPASSGPPEYAYVEAGDTEGDNTIPHNEVFRLRTRTGHQILMHNSEDLIYIGNARGTTWVEMSSNGKIDIYAHDSISVHSDQDLNFTADRDVNIEGGRNINMRAQGRNDSGGNVQIESKKDTNILVDNDMMIKVDNNQNTIVGNNYKLTVGNDSDILVTQGLYCSAADIHQKASAGINIEAGTMVNALGATGANIESGSGPLNVLSGSMLNLNGTANVNILGAVVAIDSVVSLASGAAGPASPAAPAQEAIEVADEAEALLVHQNSQVDPKDMSILTVDSIVKRMPSHEPWAQHENMSPGSVTPENTDITIEGSISDVDLITNPDTFRKNVTSSKSSTATVPDGTSNSRKDKQSPLYVGITTPVTSTGAGFNKDKITGVGDTNNKELPPKASKLENTSSVTEFIMEEEGFRPRAYWDVSQYSIGYGTKARYSNEVIDRAEARRRLEADIATRRAYVKEYSRENGYNWNSGQVDALTSFVYNLGTEALPQVTANGTRSDATIAEKMKLYNKADGRVLGGLVTRRNSESDWFSNSVA